jgi:CheY-like chemotaxis protein
MRNGGGSAVYWPNRAETLRELSGRDSLADAEGDWPLPNAPRILIVDDEPNVRNLFLTILAEDGYYVTAVATARHALLVLREREVELVILDLSLPDADGLELVREIHAEFPYTRVLAVSGFKTDNSPQVPRRCIPLARWVVLLARFSLKFRQAWGLARLAPSASGPAFRKTAAAVTHPSTDAHCKLHINTI